MKSGRPWRVLGYAALAMVLTTGLWLVLVASGVFDPRPLGRLVQRQSPGAHEIERGDQVLTWEIDDLPAGDMTLRLTAAAQTGNVDGGYGMVIGDDRRRLIAAVSPLGYASLWQEEDGVTRSLLPWQPWPHVRTGRVPNEIWLDVSDEDGATTVTVRINRELLWHGEMERPAGGAGYWLASHGETLVVDFQQLELFAAVVK